MFGWYFMLVFGIVLLLITAYIVFYKLPHEENKNK